ncbi:sporulation protein YqfD [Parapedobacter tibetensis]|uniref:sporulation protein YqfD n=1 Tax=Parapedobacter tibetensis TaxID=2972951 RepID=UPI00214D2B0A|nr:sporulation protein YqfD [Parapedobacter tibetensis]
MKFIIGFLAMLIVLALLTYVVLRIWDIDVIAPEHMSKSLKTLGVLAIGSTVLTMIIAFFFRNDKKGYDRARGSVAQPKH